MSPKEVPKSWKMEQKHGSTSNRGAKIVQNRKVGGVRLRTKGKSSENLGANWDKFGAKSWKMADFIG